MELKIKNLNWSKGLPIAMLHYKTAKKIGVHSRDMITLKALSKDAKEISTTIDVVKDIVRPSEIAISYELRKKLGLKVGKKVEVNMLSPPISVDYINKKRSGKRLTEKEVDAIISDVVSNSLSESEIALFISSIDKNGMNMKETIYLIKAILKTGERLDLKNKFIVDKHSIGGIPGNRTTPLVVSICAAAGGFVMPKNSSRAITSAAGTADVIEAIADVEFSLEEVKKIIKETDACLIWGGGLGIAPADQKIIRIEKSLKIDPEPMLIASIMSKKLAAGSNYILIDIPYGKGAKVDKKRAVKLKKKFNYLGKYFKKNIRCVLTDGSQPIGAGIGPVLELRDIIKILDPKEVGPEDLRKKAIFLAGEIFEMTKRSKKGQGKKLAEEILNSGKAFEKFKQIIKAQRGELRRLRISKFKKDIFAGKACTVEEIDNKKINSLARTAGCPVDKSSGIYLHIHQGDKIKKGQKIITIYTQSSSRLESAIDYYKKTKPILLK
ncbi:thymidine phosphorylase [Patescibacteria group bacterium]|nr:thymidine phosphorylase [Patescibacteria group bacterium]